MHPTKGAPMLQSQIETTAKDEYIKRLGYKVVSVWECERQKSLSQDKHIENFLRLFFVSRYNSRHQQTTEEQAIQKLRDGSFYGLI